MNNLADLIQDIREDEVVEINGSLDAAAEWRIEEKIMKAIGEEPKQVVYKKPNRRKWFLLAAAAVLILAFGLTSAAKNEWDIALIEFMGLSDTNTLQLEGGEVKIDQSVSCNGITITAASSIGDKNSAYIRIETDYELPDDFDHEADYIMPGVFRSQYQMGRITIRKIMVQRGCIMQKRASYVIYFPFPIVRT